MVYAGLFYNLISAIRDDAKLILVGDPGQLMPLSWGNPLIDILDRNEFQVFYLTKIQRQAARSGIISSANQIREGIDPLNGIKITKQVLGELEDMYIMHREDKDTLFDIAVKTYLRSIEKEGLNNVYLLTPRRNSEPNSTENFNKRIQDILLNEELPYIKFGEKNIFRLGAKVIHRVNNYELGGIGVMNGEQGYIIEIKNIQNGEGTSLVVEYPDKIIEYEKSNLKELQLAYALTVHLAQGSEADTCIIVLDSNSYILLNNCLLYTAITRAKKRCLLVAQPYAYDKCIKTNVGNKRNTWMRFL